MRKLKEIIVHCSATKPEWMRGKSITQKVNEIRKWHVNDRGWKDIGYHILIDRDGMVAHGRPMEQVGAHTQGHNTGTIGVCLIGGHGSSETDPFERNFTEDQDIALRRVLADLQKEYGKMTISGHNQYASKACPGFQVDRWLARKPPVTVDKEVRGEAGTAIGVTAGAAAAVAAVGTTDFSTDQMWIAIVVLAFVAGLVFFWMKRR